MDSPVGDDGHTALETMLTTVSADDFGAVMPPIYQSSLFVFENYAAFESRMAGRSNDPLYTRVQNPTVAGFETLLANAEGAEAAIGFASGMAAISASILTFVKPGDRVACVENVYPDVFRFCEALLKPFGIDVTYHSVAALEAQPELLDGVALAYLESPTSLVLEPMHLAPVVAAAQRYGAITIVDNSWATPVFQRPLEAGVDLVVHSASKYISGHSDTVAGVVAGRRDLTDRIRESSLALLGGKLAPFEAWLLIRGMRTLVPRMRQHQASANLFVERLSQLPWVERIHAPAPGAVPTLIGRSGLLSIELRADVDIPQFVDSLNLFRLGVSWGGFESLVLPARIARSQPGPHNALRRFDVPENLVRISVGLENVEDLWADLERALNEAAT